MSLLLFGFCFLLTLAGGIRISFQVLNYFFHREHNGGKRVITCGAGANGSLALQQILNNHALNLNLVGFLDESPQLGGNASTVIRSTGDIGSFPGC